MSNTSLKTKIMGDLKSAMRQKNTLATQALKLVLAECRNKEIDQKQESLSPAQITAILQKQVKSYEESIAQYEQAGRSSEEQKQRRDLIKSYLPKALTEGELKTLVKRVIAELKANSVKDMGKVIKAVQSRAEGGVDNRRLAEMAKQELL